MLRLLICFFALISLEVTGQDISYPQIRTQGNSLNDFNVNGWALMDSAAGDLNKDGKKDLALVLQSKDTVDEVRPDGSSNRGKPRILVILFKSGKGYTLALQDNHFITRAGEGGMDPDAYDSLQINNGILLISLQYVRSWMKYKFRYQDHDFFLIGSESTGVYAAGSEFESYDINFLTKKYRHEWGSAASDKSKVEWKTFPLEKPLRLSDLKMPYQTRITEDIYI